MASTPTLKRVQVMHDHLSDSFVVMLATESGFETKVRIERRMTRDHSGVIMAMDKAGLSPVEIFEAVAPMGLRYDVNVIASLIYQQKDSQAQAAVEAERLELAKMLVGDNPAPVSGFVSVAQPNFVWDEQFTTDGQGATGFPKRGFEDTEKATFSVPPGDTPWARGVKLHELMHARFTPEVLSLFAPDSPSAKFSEDVHQIAEDIRLAHKAEQLGLLSEDTYFPAALFERTPKKQRTQLEFATLYMASYGQPIEGITNYKDPENFARLTKTETLTPRGVEILTRWRQDTEALLQSDASAQDTFMNLATRTQQALDELADVPPPPGGGGGEGDKPDKGTEGDGRPQDGKQAEGSEPKKPSPAKQKEQIAKATKAASSILRPSLPKEVMAKAAASAKKTATGKSANGSAPKGFIGYGAPNRPWEPGGIRPPSPTREIAENYSLEITKGVWGEMVTRLAPLQRNFKALVKRVGPAAPDGPTPRHLHRWYADKHVFMRQGLQRGGTLLIDISGSMGWAWEDTLKLIEATPAMTIALYSGWDDHGHMTIIAKDGRLVARDFSPEAFGHSGNNTVDGPALEWLAKQPRPRVWFSDGEIVPSNKMMWPTGARDPDDYNHARRVVDSARRDSNRICRLGGIRRTVDVDEVAAIFKGKRVQQEGKLADTSWF